jgi:Cd2+/Zn2+-exporting ATPase
MTDQPQNPQHGVRCTDVLSDTLRGYAGIQQTEYDIESGKLRVAYDPRILSREQTLRIMQASGQEAVARVNQCRFKGPSACAACAGEMGLELAEHYSRLADASVPVTGYDSGTILVDLNRPVVMSHESAEVMIDARAGEETIAQPRGGETRKTWLELDLPRRKLEIALTAINALTTLGAFVSGLAGATGALITGLYIIAYLSGGYYGLMDGIATLKEKRLDVNLLMILAALGAAVIDQPLEGAILLFLFSLSNTLQTFAMERSRNAIEKLLDLRPPTATVRRGSRTVTLPVEKVMVGEVALVRPGERIPVDGEIVAGASDINQANITGESMPVHKAGGETVFAGTVNGNGALEVRVTRHAKDTTLARIVTMVEEAQASKAHTQRMLDNFEQVYALFVLAGAVVLILLPLLALNQSFYPTFYRAMTWLVVASPCALVISTPASILSAIANGARNGVLFKGGAHLEKTATLKALAFDKTGTLTYGKPELVAIE